MPQMPDKRRAFCVCLLVTLSFLIAVGSLAAIWPNTKNTKSVKKSGSLQVDTGYAKDGYILVRGGETSKRLKLEVAQGKNAVRYDLKGDNKYVVLPLQFGNGSYKLTLYRQVKGNQYSQQGRVSFSVEMKDINSPFLIPNFYINYTENNKAVKKAAEICAGLKSAKDKYSAICEYVTTAFVYDYVRAVTVKTGDPPDVDYCMNRGMGVCQDLAATAVCMMRTQGVPAKLVIGNANGQYHAWVQATVEGKETIFDPTFILQKNNKSPDYAVERWY